MKVQPNSSHVFCKVQEPLDWICTFTLIPNSIGSYHGQILIKTKIRFLLQLWVCFYPRPWQMFESQAYIPKKRTLIQVLFLTHFFCYFLMHYHLTVSATVCMSRFCVRIGWRKYLNECTPCGYVSLWNEELRVVSTSLLLPVCFY